MLAWLRDLTSRERRTMLACWGGWTLDGFDQQLYSYVVPTVIAVWGMSTGAAGTIGTVTVVTSSFGGWFAGALADRFGRVRVLQIAILWYSVFTFLCAFAQSFEQLFILRGLHGLGFGGEWATGAVLMGEVIRDKYRGRGVGFVQTGAAVAPASRRSSTPACMPFCPKRSRGGRYLRSASCPPCLYCGSAAAFRNPKRSRGGATAARSPGSPTFSRRFADGICG
jgi:MFS family permease